MPSRALTRCSIVTVHREVTKLQLDDVAFPHRLLQVVWRVKKKELAMVDDGNAITERVGFFHDVGS